jgi:hypothetical protein
VVLFIIGDQGQIIALERSVPPKECPVELDEALKALWSGAKDDMG